MRFGFFDGNQPRLAMLLLLVSIAVIVGGWTWDQALVTLQFGW